MDYVIDYFKFSIKRDSRSEHPYEVQFLWLLSQLGISEEYFNSLPDIGAHSFYPHTYSGNGIKFYVTDYYSPMSDDSHYDSDYIFYRRMYENQGFCFEFSGSGCRWLESIPGFSWRSFCQKLFDIQSVGCKLNICRVDFAYDDYDGYLDLDRILSAVTNREYVSLYRSCTDIEHHESCSYSVQSKYSSVGVGRTIYLGSRTSNSFCRIYDKLVEQKDKFKNDALKQRELAGIEHWVRFEMEFKRESAMKMINAIIYLTPADFSVFLAEAVNSYIRFVDAGSATRLSRCDMVDWWLSFIGTCKIACMRCIGVVVDPVRHAVTWVCSRLSMTLAALISCIGSERLLQIINDSGGDRDKWKLKHNQIANGVSLGEKLLSDVDYWKCYIPESVLSCVA